MATEPELTPEDKAMLSRCMSRFQMRLAMHRTGVPLKERPHPVTDDQYREALAQAADRWKDVPTDLRHALDRLHYTDPEKILYEIGSLYGVVEGGGKLLVIGDPENGCYEWVHVGDDGKLGRHSDCGYGICEVALRDGLCALIGLPDQPGEKP